MLHGSLAAFQCGPGYEGVDCARCKKEHYEDAVTGRCLQCGGGGSGSESGSGSGSSAGSGGGGSQQAVLSKAKDMATKATPLFILLGALVLVFLGIGVLVIIVRRRSGGTCGNGMQRAFHFIIYVIVLLQVSRRVLGLRDVVVLCDCFY